MIPELNTGGTFCLFVYGTLKRGGCRHHLLACQRFLGEAASRPYYALFDLGAYPGLVQCEGGGQVVCGDLYEVDAAPLALLDREEGAPELFRLAPVELEGVVTKAFAYFYQKDLRGCLRCPAGRWDNGGTRP